MKKEKRLLNIYIQSFSDLWIVIKSSNMWNRSPRKRREILTRKKNVKRNNSSKKPQTD